MVGNDRVEGAGYINGGGHAGRIRTVMMEPLTATGKAGSRRSNQATTKGRVGMGVGRSGSGTGIDESWQAAGSDEQPQINCHQ